MSKRRIKIVFVFFVLMLSMLACEASVSTANISDAYLTSNPDSNEKTSEFSGDQTFYCIVEIANAPDDTAIKAVWTAISVEGVDPNFVIDEVEINAEGRDVFTFDLQNDNLWPVGTYKVEIYLDGTLEETLEFSVQ